ncbi:MAG: aldose epimerase family protein [Pseudoflavonifractor sp.]
MKKRLFGSTKAGQAVDCYTLENDRGMTAEILTYGGVLRALTVPMEGGSRDVVLGFDRLEDYENQDKYIGAIVGRVANRIGNARFTLEGKDYPLPANNGANCLHGGNLGFDKKVWQAEEDENGGLRLTLTSPHGEEGFPGILQVEVTYALTSGNALSIHYSARTDRATPVNLTNHSYFNLKGQGEIGDHLVQIFGDYITENAADSVPTGLLLSVDGTPFDLRQPKPLGPGLESRHPQILQGAGYDHNFVLGTQPYEKPRLVAAVEAGGLRMECSTTQPGVQLYTANFLAGERGKLGAAHAPCTALCLETQSWPDAVNHPDFPTSILRPGEEYRQLTLYRFLAL